MGNLTRRKVIEAVVLANSYATTNNCSNRAMRGSRRMQGGSKSSQIVTLRSTVRSLNGRISQILHAASFKMKTHQDKMYKT